MTPSEQTFFEKIYKRHYEPLYQFIFRLIHDSEASYDIVQDTFSLMFSKLTELQKHPNPAGWLFTAARYNAMNYIRHLKYQEISDESIEQTAAVDSPEEQILSSFFPIEALKQLLTDEDVELLLDRFEKGYSIEETAKRHELTYAACKMRLSRIYHKLRRHPEVFALLLMIMEVYQ